MLEQAYQFQLDGEPIFCTKYGNGHINLTYLLIDTTGRGYIAQRVNKNVFKDPESLMKNIVAVTTHLRRTVKDHRRVLTLIPTKDGGDWFVNGDGEYWRMYAFVSDSVCFEKASSPTVFRESGVAFGRFQMQLADFPAQTLTETIPRFHDTPFRYAAFRKAVEADVCGHAKAVRRDIEFALEREAYASTLMNLSASGDLPIRVTHNDAKLNNVLFDRETSKALCVIDLDTVMPGLSVNDFGDSIRFGATTAAEDEPDLSKVEFSLPLFEAYTEGLLSESGKSLNGCEISCLRDGAKMMTLECGVRFLTDYLSGDTYFHTKRQGQNLDRCRTQFKLVADMERHWEELQKIVLRNSPSCAGSI